MTVEVPTSPKICFWTTWTKSSEVHCLVKKEHQMPLRNFNELEKRPVEVWIRLVQNIIDSAIKHLLHAIGQLHTLSAKVTEMLTKCASCMLLQLNNRNEVFRFFVFSSGSTEANFV